MRIKPRTVPETAGELSARGDWLGKSASHLKRASTSLAKVPIGPRKGSLAGLLEWYSERDARLKAAQTSLREAERLLRDDLKAIRHAAGLVERELGVRRKPGRPAAMAAVEIHRAKLEREAGQSWEQIRRDLNRLRRAKRLPTLTLSTLRSAVNPRPRPPAKKASRSKH